MVLHHSFNLPSHLIEHFPTGESLQVIEMAFPLFILSIIAEAYLLRTRPDLRRSLHCNANDCVASVSAGLVSEIGVYLSGNLIKLLPYAWILHNAALTDVGARFPTVFTVILVDFGYYWGHRSSHSISLFWAGHGVHHSSERMTLSTAVRQGILESNFTSWAWLWMAFLGIPVKTYMYVYHINQIWTFYTHTGIVDKLHPVVEFFFNTPSHHRVHHARNPHGIDRNFGGFFILWDRIFGTFEAERGTEVFGLVHPLKTGDPMAVQTFHLRDLWSAFWAAPTWRHSFGLLIFSPAVAPAEDGKGWITLEAPEPPAYEIVLDPTPGLGNGRVVRYSLVIGIITILTYLQMTLAFQAMSYGAAAVCWVLVFLQISSVNWMLEGRWARAAPIEVLRYPMFVLQAGGSLALATTAVPIGMAVAWYIGLFTTPPSAVPTAGKQHKHS